MNPIEIPLPYRVPVAITLVFILVVLIGALEVGLRMGQARRRRGLAAEDEGGGLTVNAIFALLGLMIAFTYSFTVGHYETRKQAVIDEANAIGTAFLRAGLEKNEPGVQLQQTMLDYARTRVLSVDRGDGEEEIQRTVQHTLEAQARIWPATNRVVEVSPRGPMQVSLVESINAVLDMHTKRIAASFDLLPSIVFWTLLSLAAIAVGLGGYVVSVSGRFWRYRMTAFTLVLAATMFLIVDFDRPRHGFIRVTQRPMVETIEGMEAMMKESGRGK